MAKITCPVAFPFADEALSLTAGLESFESLVVLPGFLDVHVHFREPGFSYKETIHSGSLAAAHGGYTDVFTMPNLKPVPDNLEHLKQELAIIQKDAVIGVHPYGSMTINEEGKALSDMEAMKDDVIAYSDDGKGLQDEDMMRHAMKEASRLDKIVACHCEVGALLHGGYIHEGTYAKEHGHLGISSESEWKEIERDLRIAKETGCRFHVCHISAKESVSLIREAKKAGIDVTCETGPHYLVMDDSDLQEDGRFKMNPPLRDKKDREALLEGLLDGTIDMIATDHAPHSKEEKSKGLKGSSFGIVGLETCFPILYTKLVRTGVISLGKLMDLMVFNPRKRFGLPLKPGQFSLWDLDKPYVIDSTEFASQGKATPFEGEEVYGKLIHTFDGGKIVW